MLSGAQLMVVLIVLIGVIGGIVKSRHRAERRGRDDGQSLTPANDAETMRLRDEVRQMKERIQVLERVITDNHSGHELDRQIERLRDR